MSIVSVDEVFSEQSREHITERRLKERQRYVYFVEAKTLGLIKIGSTNDMRGRLVKMQIDCPVQILLLGKIKVQKDGFTEGKVHRIFKGMRFRGEWFHDCDELREFIGAHKMGRRKKRHG